MNNGLQQYVVIKLPDRHYEKQRTVNELVYIKIINHLCVFSIHMFFMCYNALSYVTKINT